MATPLICRLRDNIEELRRSLEPKENALEALQQSLLEKDQVKYNSEHFPKSSSVCHYMHAYFAKALFVLSVMTEFLILHHSLKSMKGTFCHNNAEGNIIGVCASMHTRKTCLLFMCVCSSYLVRTSHVFFVYRI